MEKQIIFLKFLIPPPLPPCFRPFRMLKSDYNAQNTFWQPRRRSMIVSNMPSFKPEDIRNITFIGHAGAGKTTLAEAIVHRCGVTTRMGSIEEANTISDFEPEARQHKHSTNSVLLFVNYQQHEINLIDTPGYPDFIGQALASMPAVETAVIVVNAQQGLEFNARRLYHAAGEMGLARMIVI